MNGADNAKDITYLAEYYLVNRIGQGNINESCPPSAGKLSTVKGCKGTLPWHLFTFIVILGLGRPWDGHPDAHIECDAIQYGFSSATTKKHDFHP